MSRRKRKKSPSILGAILMEGLALAVFAVLFTQARAERQRETTMEQTAYPVFQEMFKQTPFRDMLVQNQYDSRRTDIGWGN